MKRCEDIRNCIADYSAGNLDQKQMALVEVHLGECTLCASELRTLEQTMALVEAVPDEEPPIGMWDAVYQQIAPQVKPAFMDHIRALFAPPARALALGFAVLALLVIMNFSKLQGPSQAVTADAATQEYVQGHVMFASQDAFADRVGLASVSAASVRGETQTQ